MANFDDVIQLSEKWPDVDVATSYGTPALKVRGKTFCRLWGPRDASRADVGDRDVLVVFCDIDEKQFLLAESDGSVFTAPHYENYGAVLIFLDVIDEELLQTLLTDSYLLKAPKSIQRPFRDKR